MEKGNFTTNNCGIRVKKCCASCVYKEQSRSFRWRYCRILKSTVNHRGVCDRWAMSKVLSNLGSHQGRVKSKEYLDFFSKVRTEEEECHHCVPLTIEDIRELFETINGKSPYIIY